MLHKLIAQPVTLCHLGKNFWKEATVAQEKSYFLSIVASCSSYQQVLQCSQASSMSVNTVFDIAHSSVLPTAFGFIHPYLSGRNPARPVQPHTCSFP